MTNSTFVAAQDLPPSFRRLQFSAIRYESDFNVQFPGRYATDASGDHVSRAWLQHALEEALDMANYLQAAISKLDEEGTKK